MDDERGPRHDQPGWQTGWSGTAAPQFDGRPPPAAPGPFSTLSYEVDGAIARITFNRPERGNAIVAATPAELAAAVEHADLDPRVRVIVLSGRGSGFCGGYDLLAFAEHGQDAAGAPEAAGAAPENAGSASEDVGPARTAGTLVDPIVQARNHDPFAAGPAGSWDPMLDYAMMSRFTRGFASLLHANKPTVAKLHGFCVAGGTDIALHCDLIVTADDTKIGYPPTRVWGVPSAGLWAHRIGDQRAKRMLLTGDCIDGRRAQEWGLAIESWPADQLDDRVEALLARICLMPPNQLMMVKLALNSALLSQGVQNSAMISTVFDGIARHTREGYEFAVRSMTAGFREAVRDRDEPFGDHRRPGPSA